MAAIGMPNALDDCHWHGDLNGDGYTDLYCSNDFGPDDIT